MKKTLLFMAAMVVAVMFVNAQGTWIATDTVNTFAASTELGMGITNLQVMHSDASGIAEKPDLTAQTNEYNEIVYDNQAFVQGSTNGMYFAFVTGADGTLDIALKMSSAKKTFVLELADGLWTGIGADANDIATLTAGLGTADAIVADPSFFALPQVYDTFNDVVGTWDGTVSIQETGESQYMVVSFPVLADKTYIVGCFGSKAMVRGVNYVAEVEEPNAVSSIDGLGATVVKTEYYNIMGHKINEPAHGITIIKNIMSDGTINTKKAVLLK